MVFILLLAALIAVQNHSVQHWAAQKAVGYLSRKLHVPVRVDKVELSLFGHIRIGGLYVQGQNGDTLLYIKHLEAGISPNALFSRHIELNRLALSGANATIQRRDSVFNFQFIADAFAGQEKAPVEDGRPWRFDAGSVTLDSIALVFSDTLSGLTARAWIGHFDTRIDLLDLEHGRLKAKSVALANSSVRLVQRPAVQQENEGNTTATYIQPFVSRIQLLQVQFSYEDQASRRNLDADIGSLDLHVKRFDLEKQLADIGTLSLNDSRVGWRDDSSDADKNTVQDSVKTTGWSVTAEQISLNNNAIKTDDGTAVTSGFDHHHLDVTRLSVEARGLRYQSTALRLELDSLRFAERSGFSVAQLSGKFFYDTASTRVDRLVLRSGNTTVVADLSLRYGSLEALRSHPEQAQFLANFAESSVSVSELLALVPQLDYLTYAHTLRNTEVAVSGKLEGSLQQLKASGFRLAVPHQLSLQLSGEARQVTDISRLYLDLPSFRFAGRGATVRSLLPDSLLSGIVLPDTFAVNGRFRGYARNFDAEVDVTSDLGRMTAHSKMNPAAGNKLQPYSFFLLVSSLEAGRILKEPALGAVSFSTEARGSGFDTATVHTELKLGVSSAVINSYTYTGLQFDGRIDKCCIKARATLRDRNIDLSFDGRLNMDPANQEYTFTADLKGADLKALKLSDDELRISFLLESDIGMKKQSNPEGIAAIRQLRFLHNGKRYQLDSLVLRASNAEGNNVITLSSPVVEAAMRGRFNLPDLPASMLQTFNSYYQMGHQPKHPRTQKFDFDLQLHDADALLQQLLPGLEKLSPVSVTGKYDSEAREIRVKGRLEQVRYAGISADSLALNVDGDGQVLSASLKAEELSNSSFRFNNLLCSAEAKNNSVALELSADRQDSSRLTRLGATLATSAYSTSLSLDPVQYLYGERWSADAGNKLVMDEAGVFADRIRLSRLGSAIACQSAPLRPGAPMTVSFTDFDLGSLSRMVENNTELVRGKANGDLLLEKRDGRLAFRSDLRVSGLVFRSIAVGDLRVRADNYGSASVYSLNLALDGNGNALQLEGTYTTGRQGTALDMDLDVRHLNLASVEPFTFGQLTRMSGALSGRVKVKRSLTEPFLTGDLVFDQAAFRPRLLDSYLTVRQGQLRLAGQSLKFDRLMVYDSLGNTAKINGAVVFEDLDRPKLDLQVSTDNFLALNTDATDNPVYYGRVFLDSDIGVRGTLDAPRVDLRARLNKGSYLTYVKSPSMVGRAENKGIVEFRDSLYHDAIMTRTGDSIDGSSGIRGMELHATVSFEKSVKLKMFVDPESGDSLYIVGGGTLDFTIDRSGRTTLTGRYRINDGGYHLVISDLVKRNFRIESGSYVYWSGDVLDAYVDLKAVYTIKASPIDLVQNEMGAMSDAERNKYRNLLTFNVYLKMTGFLSAPEISFDIQLAPGDKGALNGAVNSRLAQLREDETMLNKQVFALLTLRRFIGDNPLDNGAGGGGLSSASRSSASKVLTQQLSNLSGRYVTAVDLDLGVNSFEDYSSGQAQGRTQLQVGVSRQLLNDRVRVHVGGNVELEGERARQNNASDVAGNVSVDYKLTQDGRYRLKAFRENQYENPIEGELTKTGMGIIYIRNYNKLSELLRSPGRRQDRKSK